MSKAEPEKRILRLQKSGTGMVKIGKTLTGSPRGSEIVCLSG
jgi:hypothetical protein